MFSCLRTSYAFLCTALLTFGAILPATAQSGTPISFNLPAEFPAGAGPDSVATADFNEDGHADLAVTNSSDGTVGVLLGKGDGTFQAMVSHPVGTNPAAVVTGDFNGDGHVDLAVASGDGSVSVLLGNGDGTFQAAVGYVAGTQPSALVVADFNHDGHQDLAVANIGDNTISILLGKGDGTFHAATTITAGAGPNSIAAGDVNNDGYVDLAVANNSDNTVSILLGNGDGTFQAAVNYGAGGQPGALALADSNGDGILDLIVVDSGAGGAPFVAGNVSVLLGNGDGTFQAGLISSLGNTGTGSGYSLAVADVSGDGFLDLVVGNGESVEVLLGDGTGNFAGSIMPSFNYSTGMALSVTLADFNEDGWLDMAVTDPTQNAVSVIIGKGNGLFNGAGKYGTTHDPKAVAFNSSHEIVVATRGTYPFGDISGFLDRFQEVVNGFLIQHDQSILDFLPRSAAVLSDGSTLVTHTSLLEVVGSSPVDLTAGGWSSAVGDFNEDGIDDVATGGYAGVAVLLGNGPDSFGTETDYPVGSFDGVVALGDFNGDGHLDMVVTNSDTSVVSVMLGNGDGTFQSNRDFPTGGGPQSVAVGDFNGDGHLDLATANADGTVSILLGGGDGTFAAAVSYPAGAGPYRLVVADFNGDGNLDLAVADEGGPGVSVLAGNGDGTFLPPFQFATGANPFALAAVDVSRDGKPDLVVVNNASNSITVLTNTSVFTELPTTTSLTATPNPSTDGGVTFNSVVSALRGSPTGSVTFLDGGTPLGTVDLQAGVPASLTSSSLTAGTHSITAAYSGDFSYRPSTSLVLSEVVQIVGQPPAITSANAATFTAGTAGTFTVTATGTPAPTLTETGSLPAGLTFNPATGALGGTPSVGAGGVYPIAFSASNSVGSTTQNFTLMVQAAPSITSANTASFTTGAAGTFTVTGSGFPVPAFSETGALPAGLSFNTGVLSGTPAAGTGGTYPLTITASNGVSPTATQNFTLTVIETPKITWATPSPIAYGTPLTATQLNATANVPGTFAYTPPATTVLGAGTQTLSTSFTASSGLIATATVPLVVNRASSTLTLASSVSPSVYSQALTLTATIVPQAGGTATGSVAFHDGAVTLGNATVSGNSASMSVNSLAAGVHTLTAVYNGDANVAGSTSASLPQTVNKATTISVLTSSINPSLVTQSVTLTAAVTSQFGGATSGNVTFKSGNSILGTGPLVNGVAVLNFAFATTGASNLTAVYAGDANNTTSTSAAVRQTVNKISTTTALTSSGTPSFIGQPVTFTATVTPAISTVPDGDTVTFRNGGVAMGTAVTSGGVATFTTSSLAVGNRNITAVFAGDSNLATSTSPAFTQVVGKYTSSTSVTSSVNPSAYGQAVTFTANVAFAGPTPTGTITFKSGTTTLATQTLSGATASYSTSALTAGAKAITAVYSGDANYAASTSAALTQTVNKAVTTTTVVSSPDPSIFPQVVTFTVTVTASGATPTGTVAIKRGTISLGTVTLNASGVGTLSTNSLPRGGIVVTANYNGTANFATSSGTVLQTVK